MAELNVTVSISGLDQKLEQNARLFLSIEQLRTNELLTPGRLKRLHQKAPQEIQSALQPFGYYQVRVESELTRLDEKNWHASYQVDKGRGIPIGVLDIKVDHIISQDPDYLELMQASRLKIGRRFRHEEYEELKAGLARVASENGYAQARFTQHRVEIDLKSYSANIYLHFEAGARYQFGAVHFSQVVLDEDLLRRYIPFKQGDPFSLTQLLDLQQALNDSDYFSEVEVTSGALDTSSQQIPVEIKLSPRKRHRLSLGLGYGTDTGARTKFGWQIPRYNSRGHRINTQASISELGYSLSAQYSIPILNPRTDQLIYSAGEVNEKTDTSESTVQTLGASLKHTRGKWRETLSINYQQENYLVADVDDQTTLLIPGMNWSRIWGKEFWGNDLINFFDGVRLDLGLRLADSGVISDLSFSQANGSIKSINRLGASHRILTRGRIGVIDTRDFDRLPASIRYFAGGAQSVRGYAYQSLGPEDSDGEVTGGQYLMEGSIEYEYSFKPKWGLAVFFDAGNALNNLDDDLQEGAGFGLRWQSPIGPVRFDLASALSRDGKPWRLHINIGPDL